MSVKIKDAELISEVSEEIMIPVGNTGEESKAQAVKVSQLKENIVEGLATVDYVDNLVGTINNTLGTI